MGDDYYNILNVNENASQDEIKKSYRKLSLLYHPDKNQGNTEAEAKFKQINEAYQVIGDENERKKYDMSKNNPFASSQANHHGMNHMNVPMNDVFKMFFGGGGIPGMSGMPGMPGFPMGNVKIFRNGQPVDTHSLNKPPPIIKNVFISLEQAYNGDQIPVQIERWLFEDNIRKIENETIYIPIAKGTDDKEIIILRDKGNIMDNNLKGDVKIVINIQNTTIFKRDGLTLYMEKEISLKDSLCGFHFIINFLNGKQLRFNSEVGKPTKDGLVKAIPGFGMERENNKGNLCIKFSVKYPEKITEEQIARLKEIL